MSRRLRVGVFAAIAVCGSLAPDLRAQAGYGGPSLLSRGGNRPGMRGRAPIDFTGYISARGLYETGLLTPRLDENGQFSPINAFGVQGEVGVYGGKDWRRNSLGVDFRGDYRHQPEARALSGSNQAISVESQHRLTRRVMLMLQQTGGTSNRAFGGFAAPAIGNIDRLGVPLNELFDVRVYYTQSSASISYQRSARTTFIVGADGFFIKRKSASLVNGQGYRAQGAWNYRYTRRTTFTTNFQYLKFEFPRIFSSSDVYSLGFGVQRDISRSVRLEAIGGLYLVKSAGVQIVQLTPEVAAILGRTTGAAAFLRNEKLPMVQTTLSYTQERGRATLAVSSGVNPGNGAFLTMRRTSVDLGYSYTGIRRTSVGISAGYSRFGSVVLDLQQLSQFQAGAGLSYRFAEHLSIMAQADRRQFKGTQVQGRTGTSVSIGLAYSPSRLPISIW